MRRTPHTAALIRRHRTAYVFCHLDHVRISFAGWSCVMNRATRPGRASYPPSGVFVLKSMIEWMVSRQASSGGYSINWCTRRLRRVGHIDVQHVDGCR